MAMARGGSSLSKALTVLDGVARLDGGQHPVSVSDIVELTGLEKSQVSRMLSTFAEHGYVERVGQRKGYRLGWHSYLVGRRAQVSQLGELMSPHVEQLGKALEQPTYFSILTGVQGVTIASYEPDLRLYVQSWDGRPFAVLGSAVGVCLLLDRSEGELALMHQQAVDLAGGAEWDLDTLRRHVEAARAADLSRIENEHAVGISTIAVPVRLSAGEITGVLSVTVPVPVLTEERASTITAALRDVVARVQSAPRPSGSLG
jgi:DNA-binding IclR family transcriptional regulator